MSEIVEITPAQLEQLITRRRPVLVEFIKDNCPWCMRQKPELSQISAQWEADVDIVAVAVDGAPELVERYGLRGTPTLVLLRDGKRLASKNGFQRAQQIRPFLRHYLDDADANASGI